MKKKIALHGSNFVDNFGDSLFVVCFYNWLKEANIIEDKNIILPFANQRVRDLVEVSNTKGILGLLKSDKVVFIGGGYLGERPHKKLSWNIRLIIKHLSIGLFATLFKKPFIFIGVGAGPLTNSISRKIVVYLCNKSEKTIVRDEESQKHLLNYGVKEEKIKTTADSILLFNGNNVDTSWDEKYKRELVNSQSSDTIYIGVHLQASSNKKEKIKLIIDDLAKYCNGLSNYKVVVFNDTYKRTPDHKLLSMLSQKFSEEKIINIEYANPDQLIALINNLDIVITTKLHCGIVANCLGKYTLSISVHDKTIRLYKQLELQERNVSINEYKQGKLEKMLLNYDKSQTYNDNVPLSIRERAAENHNSFIDFVKQN